MAELNLTTDPPADGFPWEVVVGLVPHLLWAMVAIGLVAWIGPEAIRAALKRLTKVGVAGLELEFRDELEAAAEAQGKTPPPGHIGRASRRLAASEALIRGAKILWVDDEPRNNRFEGRLLEAAGARITQATSTETGLAAAEKTTFDVVISDMARGAEMDAGLRLCRELAVGRHQAPVVLYVGHADKPVPSEAFGITDTPDELVHLVLDALARRRG